MATLSTPPRECATLLGRARCEIPQSRNLGGPFRDGPDSGENISHLCRLKIFGCFGLDPDTRVPLPEFCFLNPDTLENDLFDAMYLSISFGKSTSQQNRQLHT